MSKLVATAIVRPTITFTVEEVEARALDALAGYGDDAFIKHFYQTLGEAYMKPHEAGLRSFLKTIRDFMPGQLARIDNAREAIS